MAPMGGNADATAPIVAKMEVVGRVDLVQWRPSDQTVEINLCEGALLIVLSAEAASILAHSLERELSKRARGEAQGS